MSLTRTFLFTDIEGSTRSQQHDPTAWRINHALHDRIVEEVVGANGGDLYLYTGDGYHAAFVTAPEAVKAALQIQRKLSSADWQGSNSVRARMALHTGKTELRGSNYLGDELHRAARLMDAGHGGQVLLSLVTTELVREELKRDTDLAGVELRELGVFALRDLREPERIFQLVAPGLQQSFPALRTESAFFTNLPAELDVFIGRREELMTLCREVSATRLLTIVGSGGVGKTRTALHLAREVAGDFKDGVALVDLASVSDPNLVVQTVAAVFSLGESGASSLLDSVVSYLQKKSLLLVFDNCEHLLDACANLISTLLNKSPQIKVVATSRERLDVDGETVYGLPMLSVPAAAENIALSDLQLYPAMELFVAVAVNADSSFRVTEKNVSKIGEICRHLDGNALAIKLAASLTPALSVDEMLERLRMRFEVLVQPRRQTDPRHKTLKAAMDWSYELLSADEATIFRRLAIFAGSWSLDAAECVCVDETVRPGRLVTILNSLVRKNLVIKMAGEPESRFGMLETVREYAKMQLHETKEAAGLRQVHAKCFLDFAKREVARTWGAEPQVGLSRLEQDYDDLVTALEWSRETDAGQKSGFGLQLAAELGIFWERRGYLSEGRDRLARALRSKRLPEHDKYRAEGLDAAARLAFLQYDYEEAIALYEKSLKLRRQLAAEKHDIRLMHGVIGVLNKIGLGALRNGDFAVAETRLVEALELAKETNHTRGTATALNHLAELAWRRGDYEGAKERYEECLEYARHQRGKHKDLLTMDALAGQGKVLMMQGKYDDAAAAFAASLKMRTGQVNKTGAAFSLSDLSEVAFRKGDHETARKYARESLALRQEARNEWGIGKSLYQLAQAEHKLGLRVEALQHVKESLIIFERLEYKKGIAECLMRIAAIRFDLGDKETAAALVGAADSLLDSLGPRLAPDQRDYYESAMLSPLQAELDSRDCAKGRHISLETAILLAQGENEQ